MSENTAQDEANVEATKAGATLAKAQAVRQLVDGGFSQETASVAVESGDMSGLAPKSV